RGGKVAVIGDFARKPRYQGAGSSIVNPTVIENTLECLKEFDIDTIGYAEGFHRYGKRSKKRIDEACALAQKADVVLLYIGLDEVTEAEGLDRKNMKLQQNQIELINEMQKVNSNIIAVLSCGSAIEMPWIGQIKGLIHSYLGGQAGAKAILRVITGQVNPSGKLTETYPIKYEDTPTYRNFPGKEVSVEYRESLYIGYRYFDTAHVKVLFPFGYGLSYTNFEYSKFSVTDKGVTFTIKNTGKVAGSEVAQMYVGCKSKEIFRPKKELKGFTKVFLNPGEEKKVSIDFDDKTFRYFNVKTNNWEIEESDYEIIIGASIEDIRLQATLSVEGTKGEVPYNKVELPSYYSGRTENITVEEFEKLLGHKVPTSTWDKTKDLGYNDTVSQCRYAKGWVARFVYRMIIFAHWLLIKIGKRDTANMIIMSVYHMPFRGIVRMTGGIMNMPMLDGLLIAANGHLFKGIAHMLREHKNIVKGKKIKSNGNIGASEGV
ncbi:MAG: glycoside hydrolase family 3 C-terminal domain-containing protein, partial [Clostridium sp.]